jgi:GntR family transcriptional regulator
MLKRLNPDDLKVRQNKAPLYDVVRDKIYALVEAGVFRPGSKLPRETELAEMLNISRSTLREALRLAQMEGWVIQKHGVGNFVTRMGVVEEGLEALESIDTLSKRQGWRCDTIDTCIETKPADQQIASALGLAVGAPIVSVSRVKTGNGKRVAYIEDYFPADLAPIQELRVNFRGSVLDFFIARGEPQIDYAWTNVQVLPARKTLSEKLFVPEGMIIFLAEETLFSHEGQPFEYSLNYLRTDFFKFHIVRTIPKTTNPLKLRASHKNSRPQRRRIRV